MKKVNLAIICFAFLMMLTGCSHHYGSLNVKDPLKTDAMIRSIKIGVTTKADILRMFGPPFNNNVSVSSVWDTWGYYGNYHSFTDKDAKGRLSVVFDHETGRVVRWSGRAYHTE